MYVTVRCRSIAAKILGEKNGDSQHVIHAMGHCHIDSGIVIKSKCVSIKRLIVAKVNYFSGSYIRSSYDNLPHNTFVVVIKNVIFSVL